MIQYNKLFIIKDNITLGTINFDPDEILTIDLFKQYLQESNIINSFSDEEIQSIIDSQFLDVEGENCCVAPPPVIPEVEYSIITNNSISFTITNYIEEDDYIIQIKDKNDLTLVFDNVVYTEPTTIELPPSNYTFTIIVSNCNGSTREVIDIELQDITITLNLFGNIESSLVTNGTTIQIPSFVGDSIIIDSNTTNIDSNLWYIDSIIINGYETINNELYTISKTLNSEINSPEAIQFTIPTITESLVIDIYGVYNNIEWCEESSCIECEEQNPPLNNPPVAVNDNYSTDYQTLLTVPVPGVLSNDSDPNNDNLFATLLTTTSNGTLNFDLNGSFTYTPNNGFSGNDSFTYLVSDRKGGTASATVTITTRARVILPPVCIPKREVGFDTTNSTGQTRRLNLTDAFKPSGTYIVKYNTPVRAEIRIESRQSSTVYNARSVGPGRGQYNISKGSERIRIVYIPVAPNSTPFEFSIQTICP